VCMTSSQTETFRLYRDWDDVEQVEASERDAIRLYNSDPSFGWLVDGAGLPVDIRDMDGYNS
jgi:hypothetical protein